MELHIGQKLKKFRRDKDLTQEEVAKHLGISFQSISKWERLPKSMSTCANLLRFRNKLYITPRIRRSAALYYSTSPMPIIDMGMMIRP